MSQLSIKVKKIMDKDPITIDKNETLIQGLRLLEKGKISHLILLSGEKVEGIVSEKDVLAKLGTTRTWRTNLSRFHLSSFIRRPPITIDLSSKVGDAIGIMMKEEIGFLPVVENHKLVGVVSKQTLVSKLKFEPLEVSNIFTSNVKTIAPSTPVPDARRIINEQQFSSLPVIEGFKLVGVLTDTRLLQAITKLYKRAEWRVREQRFRRMIVADIFSRQLNTLHPSDGISLAAEILANKDVKSLVIVDERDFIMGILTKSDLLSYLFQKGASQ